eukprot:1533191-Pleurochrysis_carterae.AAC.1
MHLACRPQVKALSDALAQARASVCSSAALKRCVPGGDATVRCRGGARDVRRLILDFVLRTIMHE